MSIYVDTSFLVSLYIPDRHSVEAQRRVQSRPAVWLTPLHRAEWTQAVAQHVFQRKMSAQQAQQLHHYLERDCAAGLWLEVALPDLAFDICVDLARRHGARLDVRTLDSLHVASALELKAERFWTFDERQAKLAEQEGLRTS